MRLFPALKPDSCLLANLASPMFGVVGLFIFHEWIVWIIILLKVCRTRFFDGYSNIFILQQASKLKQASRHSCASQVPTKQRYSATFQSANFSIFPAPIAVKNNCFHACFNLLACCNMTLIFLSYSIFTGFYNRLWFLVWYVTGSGKTGLKSPMIKQQKLAEMPLRRKIFNFRFLAYIIK